MVDSHVPSLLDRGWTGFKLKVGFGLTSDVAAIERFRRIAGSDSVLMIDANQRFDVDQAAELASALRGLDVAWFEEPISAVAPASQWAMLAAQSSIPLAAGENVRGHAAFDALMDGGSIRFIQPDLIKWGGVSAAMAIAERARLSGLSFCPHYLGGGIGLRATAHVVAASSGDWLEFDVTDNPFREALVDADETSGGVFRISEQAGHGAPPDMGRLAKYLIASD
jgi:L-alanine-DL-glutamate epimerase-like enolase superfamily enzyme